MSAITAKNKAHLTSQNKDVQNAFRELKAEYLYMLIPFGMLIAIKGLRGDDWQGVLLAPDWALVASIILGQITARVGSKIASSKTKANESGLSWYSAKRFGLVLICTTVYCFMLIEPSVELGMIQVGLFILASWFHFKDGMMVKVVLK